MVDGILVGFCSLGIVEQLDVYCTLFVQKKFDAVSAKAIEG